MKKIILLLSLTLFLFSLSANAQIKGHVYELGFPITDTNLTNSYKWRVSGWVYPEGTYQRYVGDCENALNPFAFVPTILPIGVYTIYGNYGDSHLHDARYVINFYNPNGIVSASYVFSGLFEYSEANFRPDLFLLEILNTSSGQYVLAEWRPRSGLTFGGSLVIFE